MFAFCLYNSMELKHSAYVALKRFVSYMYIALCFVTYRLLTKNWCRNLLYLPMHTDWQWLVSFSIIVRWGDIRSTVDTHVSYDHTWAAHYMYIMYILKNIYGYGYKRISLQRDYGHFTILATRYLSNIHGMALSNFAWDYVAVLDSNCSYAFLSANK